jgi:hypothetical protein
MHGESVPPEQREMPWQFRHGISLRFDRGEGAARPGSNAMLGTQPVLATAISEFFINLYHIAAVVKNSFAGNSRIDLR